VTNPTDTDAPTEAEPAESGRAGGALRRVVTRTPLARWVELLAVLPAVAMIVEIAQGPRMQFADYWYVLIRIVNPDGSLHPPGLFVPQNEHLMVLPSVLYWLDATLVGGDNRVLGYLVVLIAAATVLLLRAALPKSLHPLVRAGIVVAASLLVFSPHGLHNYVRAMSGAAWLTANLIAVLAVVLASRGRWWPAWAAGVLASLSYGTGFAVWPALLLLALLRREPWWRRLMPVGIGLVVVAGWLALKPEAQVGAAPASDAGTLLYQLLTVVGHVWTTNEVGVAVGVGVLILAGYALVATTAVGREPGLRVWWALGCFGFFSCAMIATARVDYGTNIGLTSRYTSLSVLVSLPLLVFAISGLRGRLAQRPPRLAILAVAAGVLGFALGTPEATGIRNWGQDDQLHAIAVREGYAEAFPENLANTPDLEPRLRALRHYPFNDQFSLGCGGPELDSRVDLADIHEITAADAPGRHDVLGWLDKVEPHGKAAIVRGWAVSNAAPVQCAMVVDGTGRVAGGGRYGQARPDVAKRVPNAPAESGFAVIGPAAPDCLVVIVLTDGRMFGLPLAKPDKPA
jgi:hypothetical protein